MGENLSSPSWWWDEVVLKNHKKYMDDEKRPDWKGFNAVISMHHMWERVYWWNVQNAQIPTESVAKKHEEYFHALLRKRWEQLNIDKEMEALEKCANASKHSRQVRKKPEATATGSFCQIVVDNGETRYATKLLAVAKEFWEKHLDEFQNMTATDFKTAIGYEKGSSDM
jgi:hypothetical protein